MSANTRFEKTIATILDGKIRPLVLADYGDQATLDEVVVATQTRLEEVPNLQCGAVRTLTTEALFDVNHGGLEMAKRLFPPKTRRAPRNLIIGNVAQIAETMDEHAATGEAAELAGVRDDRILIGGTESSMIISFSDHGSPMFGEVLPHLSLIGEFHPLPADLDVLRDLNFRSRDFLTWLAKRILSKDQATLDAMEFVPVEDAAAKFEITPVDHAFAWFVDEFGRHLKPTNIKTGFSMQQAHAAGLNFGDTIELKFDDGSPVKAVFERSCSRLKPNQVGLVGSSSSIEFPNGKPAVQLLDIMVKGARAWPIFEATAYKCDWVPNCDGVTVPVERKQPLTVCSKGKVALGPLTRTA